MADGGSLVDVRGLGVTFPPGRAVVRDVSFTLGAETVGLVGASGSGKSTLARALVGMVPAPGRVDAARLAIEGRDVRGASPAQWRGLRGGRIAFMMQDPVQALNPVLPVGMQVEEGLRLHAGVSAAERRRRALDLMRSVGFEDSERVHASLAHQISGGMAQRAMLAAALIADPAVLIADEPTSALDAAVRERVLALMAEAVRRRRMGCLVISHDLRQVARHCGRVLVMHAGRIVEECAAGMLDRATHPYTRALWACRPSAETHGTLLPTLPPELREAPP